MIKGTLYGVGVGPGDPRLMTYLAVDKMQFPIKLPAGSWKIWTKRNA